MEINNIINKLKTKRKIFYSESDFQFSLAWEIKEYYKKDADIRLEYPYPKMNMYIDMIVIFKNKIYPIEVKYKTKKIDVNENNEIYHLKNQAAQDLGRYDYLKDIQRIESLPKIINNFVCEKGFTIILTNDNSYWKKKQNGIDEQFHLDDGVIKTGSLKCADHASKGSTKGRTDPIELNGKYKINWNEYSVINDPPDGVFKYCLNEIDKL